MKLKQLWSRIKPIIKKRWWHIFLLIISSIYIIIYRFDIYQLTELNAQNLIFILWLILLGLPLFSEIEIGSVKLKKEIEQTRAEVKESMGELRYQILEMKVNNTNSNMLVFSNQPLPSKDELSQLQQNITHDNPTLPSDDFDFKIPENNIYLFQVRLSLEQQLSTLCYFFNCMERRPIPAMVQFLVQHEVFDRKTAELIREIINITNRGVHGEIIDDDYVRFVKNTYPAIKKALEIEYNYYTKNRYYFECPRCKYTGPSKYRNECPRCGFISDDD